MIALIGIILLIGIVKKNGIMMVDFALHAQRDRGFAPREAIREACLLRFRPIMMTTMCTLFSGLPLMLGHGAGSELRRPAGLRDGRRIDPVADADLVHDAGGVPVSRAPARLVPPAPDVSRPEEWPPRPAAMKVLIIEDERKTADYLQQGLTEQGCAVDVAYDGIDGQHLAVHYDHDVIVLDAMLPGLSGFELLRSLRAVKNTPVIMLTARDGVEDRVQGLREGADDYLVKPFSFVELYARLQAVTRRGRRQEVTLLRVGALQVDLHARRASRDGHRIDLTAKEFALLALLARRQGEILSKTTIAELVWDMHFDSHTNVVEVAIKRLRAKIDAPFAAPLLHTIRGMGYVLEERAATS